jgi:elongation factor 1 alpha-like protein
MEPDLVVACADAAEAEGASSSGAASGADVEGAAPRPGLHLVVLGHVDAGKSTLMGRMLHEVGSNSNSSIGFPA